MPHKTAEQGKMKKKKWLQPLYDKLKNHDLCFLKFLCEQTAMLPVDIKYVETIFSMYLIFTYIK